jgi:hypothetical protein
MLIMFAGIFLPPRHDRSRVVDLAKSRFGETAGSSHGHDDFLESAAESQWEFGGCVEFGGDAGGGVSGYYEWGCDEYGWGAVLLYLSGRLNMIWGMICGFIVDGFKEGPRDS